MNIPLVVTAGYGEIRPNHFHSGIDFSTQGKNQDVIAIADGYLSRVKVSQTGYGNALYIDHPTGYTSVYAHLDDFSPRIRQFVENMQKNALEFEIDVLVDSALILVKRGQVIGKSGNSGSSTAPHLHFEIRDRIAENTFNPCLFGFAANDHSAPLIQSLYVIPKNRYGTVNGKRLNLRLPLVAVGKTGKRHVSPKIPKPVLSGWVGFGFEGGDVIGKPGNYSGIYHVQILVDSNEIFRARFDQFSFDESRAVNAWIDYPARVQFKKKIQRCVVPANQLIGVYKSSIDQGYFNFSEDKNYTITYVFTDAAGNQTRQNLQVRGSKSTGSVPKQIIPPNHALVNPEGSVLSSGDQVRVVFSEHCLYDTTVVKFLVKPAVGISSTVEIGTKLSPVHSPFQVLIKPKQLSGLDRSKLLIARKSGTGFSVLSTSREGAFLKAGSKEFGEFFVVVDTIAPKITLITAKKKNPKTRKLEALSIQDAGKITLSVKDPVSNHCSFQAYLNDAWVMFSPARKSGEWEYRLPPEMPVGDYQLTVNATDMVGNTQTFQKSFTIK